MFLPPAVSCWPQRVVAGKAGKLRIFRPDLLFVEALVFGAPGQPLHRRVQLHRLTRSPLAQAGPRRVFRGLSGLRFARDFPVPRHYRRKRIELEIQVGMPRGDHFVVDEFVSCTQMAFQAFLGAMNHVARVVHAQRDGFFMLP